MFSSLLITCLLCLHPLEQSTTPAVADTIYFSDEGYTKFTSSVPLHTFSGESDKLIGMIDFEKNVIDFYIDLNTLETGNGKRDRDMLETLNAEQHPFAEFSGKLEPMTELPAIGEEKTVTASGNFSINGLTSDLTVEGTMQNQNGTLILEAAWEISLSEYNIEPPGILFYRVNDIQEVEIRVSLKPTTKSELNIEN